MILRCPCEAEAKTDKSNVGEIMKSTGFTPIFTYDTALWLCPICTPKVAAAGSALWALLGRDEYVFLPGLIQIIKEAEQKP
jgi:hypothetical protein